jgi:hypothetical protein
MLMQQMRKHKAGGAGPDNADARFLDVHERFPDFDDLDSDGGGKKNAYFTLNVAPSRHFSYLVMFHNLLSELEGCVNIFG